MTGEGKGQTEPWIQEHGATYPYAYDPGNKTFASLGLSSRPSAVLVDPTGTIVYKGHPNSITNEHVEKALEGALEIPLWEWPVETSKVQKALKKATYGKALAEAETLAQSGFEGSDKFLGAVKNLIAGKAKAVESAYDSGDYLGAQNLAKLIGKSLKGLPEADTVKAVEKKLAAGDAKKVIKAQKAILKATAERPRRQKHADKAIKALQKIAKKNAGTYAEKQANEHIAKLEKLKERLP